MPDKIFVRNISDELWRKMKSHCALQGKTVSQALREAIMLWLANIEEMKETDVDWKGITGLGKSGVHDVSEKHDDYLADYLLEHRSEK